MVTVTPFNIVLDRMATLSRAMDQAFSPAGNTPVDTPSWAPPVDATETGQAYVVSLDLPGVTADKVDLNFERNTLTVRGERPSPAASSDTARVFFAERAWGTFERSLRFPQHVEGDKISATFADGVLTVTVPKSESAKPRKIEVK